ncbi:hypothetical protein SSP531S_58670 [Streptomyces spongiicola]|uniref:Uncharacterized protein n=1 Tax=Streptomyces spongiicola TaxID=1690221 RepID=A0A388T615_9ACTN|nr:hypothetical protein [Streptomyces spongiicola]GBQ04373.1 hypothetical protein SSP531S_58670 [Streptomyces spongiicola]
MTPTAVAPVRPVCPAQTLAERVAELLPQRAGIPWTVEPYTAWWTVRYPAARLVQGGRALVLVARSWDTQIGWQLPDREPTRPDLHLESMSPAVIAREALRLVLPVLDDEAAGRAAKDGPRVMGRLELLNEIGHAMRLQGAATYNRIGLLVNTSTLAWAATSGARYSVTLHGTNPVADLQIQGPVRAVEKAVTYFLPPAADERHKTPRVRGRLQRRLAAVLARHGHVEQTDQGGLAFSTGPGPGPYGYATPAADAQARAHDTTPASVDLHGVGADFLIFLAPQLCC